MRPLLQILLSVVVLLGCALIAKALIDAKEEPESTPPTVPAPIVELTRVTSRTFELDVVTQGEVRPRMETALSAEVSGRVTFVSPALESGAFFLTDDVLVRLDTTELELQKIQAAARVRQAETLLERERAEVAVAERAYKDLGAGTASPLAMRGPQLAEAQARVAAAEADLKRVELDLERSTVRAPYDGRVRGKMVGLGQVVVRSQPLAELYATDAAEVRLLLTDKELSNLDLPLGFHAGDAQDGPRTTLRARFAGKEHTWPARIVRTEGELDPGTRMVAVVARVEDPYGRLTENAGRPPLFAGLFVSARIQGRLARDVFVLPRRVLRGTNEVFLHEDEGRLAFRRVELLWSDSAQVVLVGLDDGDQIVVTPLATPVEGMRIEVAR